MAAPVYIKIDDARVDFVSRDEHRKVAPLGLLIVVPRFENLDPNLARPWSLVGRRGYTEPRLLYAVEAGSGQQRREGQRHTKTHEFGPPLTHIPHGRTCAPGPDARCTLHVPRSSNDPASSASEDHRLLGSRETTTTATGRRTISWNRWLLHLDLLLPRLAFGSTSSLNFS